jgi:predicted XRE-type DNA-binding protein
MRYPNESDIKDILTNINDDDFVKVLPNDASMVERTKYLLCKKFVQYLSDHENISQAELARRIGVDRSRINCIVKYKIDMFTIDALSELWSVVEPNFELKVS